MNIMDLIKKNKTAVLVAFAAFLALFFALILPGVKGSFEGVTISAKTLAVAFGGADYEYTSSAGHSGTLSTTGGMSIFGLISVLLLFLSIVLAAASVFVEGKNLDSFASLLLFVSGIFMLLLLVAGTDVTLMGTKVEFSEVKDAYNIKLSIGAIIYAIVAILGGAFGIYNKVTNKD